MFKNELSLVPHKPGSYQMYNKNNIIIYVGKAKDLNKRLKSYFSKTLTGKTAIMVSEIDHFKYIVTSSELESFILELNLIKEYKPKYNILLKDDKSYPYIEYISKPYPKLKIVRYLNIKKKNDRKIYGPYPNAYAARRIVDLINRLYPLKKCEGSPKEVCLFYHINECLGYCVKNINNNTILKMEEEITKFLNGDEKFIKNKLLERINRFSESLNFEKALELQRELQYINIILDKQKVELNDLINRDVINYYYDKNYISLQIFFLRRGKIIGRHDDIFTFYEDELDSLETYIANFYSKHEIPKEILVPNNLYTSNLNNILNNKLQTISKGKKKKLLDMAYINAKLNLNNYFEMNYKNEEKNYNANEELKNILKLSSLYRIDIFDNSNLFGSYYVSGMVVFKNGIPAKKDYRKYKINSAVKDDYNAMKEILYRRYQRMLVEKAEKPDLILLDGGIQQINACKEILDSLSLNIKICGLVKNDKHKTSELLDGDTLEIYNIDKMSNLFHYLENIQNEVHRFTINFHRQIRSKGTISSTLDNISGIGKERKKALILKYKNITNIKNASVEDLSNIIPKNVAIQLTQYLNNDKTSK